MSFSEADMYEPIKAFFSSLGYIVNGEVKNCDMVITRDDELLIIELKKSMNLSLIFQAMNRQKQLSDQVYVAIPRLKNSRSKLYRNIILLIQKLELGLIFVAMDSPAKTVEIIHFPPLPKDQKPTRLRAKVLKEAAGRTLDLNRGGSTKIKILTAFREKTIKIACCLEKYGEKKPSELVKLGCDSLAGTILYQNNYGWFKKVSFGVYDLSEQGRAFLQSGEFDKIVEFYRNNTW